MQNDMRDRLVELIRGSDILCDTCGESTSSYCSEAIADYLIENGVIVPPCKVGDTIYDISEFYDGTISPEMYEYKVNHIDYIGNGRMEIEFITYPDKCWGKVLFFNRKQAEQKLKELRVENAE